MGHTMPTSARFYDAMAWVDEPWREHRRESISKAKELLEAFKAGFNEGPASKLPKAREMLVEITRMAPWSEPAWEAAAILEGMDQRDQ